MNTRALPLTIALALTASAARAQFCPPSESSCQTDFMNGAAKNDPTQTIAAYDPPPGQTWASDTCRHVPCAIVPDPAQTQKAKPEVQGPPSMEAFDNGVLKGNLLRFPDGTVTYCFDNSCSTRLTPDQAKAYLDKKAADDANKKVFAAKNDKSGGEGAGHVATASTHNKPTTPADDGDTTTPVANNPGYEDGKSVASMFDISGAGKIGSGSQDAQSDQGDQGGKGAPTDANGQPVILVDGNIEVGKHDGFTFEKTVRNAMLLRAFSVKTAGAFSKAPDPDAETPIKPEPTRAATNSD